MVPCGTPSCALDSGAALCVGPIMKFPSALAGAFVPSGNSFAGTYPGVFGSRVGGVGRAGALAAAGAWAGAGCRVAVRLIKKAIVGSRNTSKLLDPGKGFRTTGALALAAARPPGTAPDPLPQRRIGLAV